MPIKKKKATKNVLKEGKNPRIRQIATGKAKKAGKRKNAPRVKREGRALTSRRAEKKKVEQPKNFEEFLEEKIANKNVTFINTPTLQDIIYSSTPSLREIAYKSGFSFGKSLYEHGKGIEKLAEALEAAGLKDLLYYPFEDRAIIKAKPESSYNIGKQMHIFESGIIAGFMSAASGKIIYVRENKCTFDGSEMCEFLAEPKESLKPEGGYNEDIVEDIANAILSSKTPKLSQEYMLFSMLPLMKEPIKDEIAKVFFAAGSKLGEMGVEPEKLGEKFGIKIAKTKKGFVLSYSPLNSLKGFVDISSALFAGMARSMGSKSVELSESPTKENTYKVYIRLA
ncbi:MAG: V4R domain-containing protein [Candidatus Micrarchaeia archaeon]